MEVPLEDIYHLLETNQLNKVREILVDLQPVDIAELFEEMSKEQSLKLLEFYLRVYQQIFFLSFF